MGTEAFLNVNLDSHHGMQGRAMVPTAKVDFFMHPNNDKRCVDFEGWLPVDSEKFYHGSKSFANSYLPIQMKPMEGDVTPWLDLCKFIYGDYWEKVMQHFAFTIQEPSKKLRWQILTYGAARTGKTFTIKPLLHIFADASISVTNEALSAGWGDIYYRRKMLVFEEILQPENRNFYNTIKTKMANDGVEELNIKASGVVYQQNCYSVYMFSNHEDALKIDKDDGKLLVINSPKQPLHQDVYQHLDDLMDNHNLVNKIYNYLLNYNLSGFNYTNPVDDTPAALNMMKRSVAAYQEHLHEMIDDEAYPFDSDYIIYQEIKDQLNLKGYKPADRGVRSVLEMHGYVHYHGVKWMDGKTKNVRRWVKRSDVLDNMSAVELYDEFNK
jgi:hypothetical protein